MTQNKTYRMHQVNRLVQEEVAGILLKDMQDELLRNITVTEVRTSKDLRHATVYITILDERHRDEIVAVVSDAAGYIRKLLGSRIRLKRTPELEFKYDESLNHAVRILDKIKDIEHELHEDDEE